MRRLPAVVLLAVVVTACDSTPPPAKSAQVQTINTVLPVPAPLDPPPMLNDEAPPPKPKALPWETPTPIVFSPEDEKLRASLPFSPAIAMDPIDGSKISMRATTPTFEYKGKIYYFSSEENKRTFAASPEQYVKSGYMRL
ncbi:MAG TPA: YHS domain-containing protein [Thermoanaerobaculia bacterium]|nr:YHS domain-containing protein [Thermoanaerobaculia bacterium]